MEIQIMRRKVEPVTILIDKDDFERLGGRKVSIGSHGYAQIWEPTSQRVMLLHRWILGLTERTYYSVVSDHINRDRLDNRRENLRIVSPTDSNDNRMSRPRVYDLPKHIYHTKQNYFSVAFKRNRKTYHAGNYRTLEKAIEARDEWLANHKKTEEGYVNG